MRLIRRALPVAAFAVLLMQTAASAVTVSIQASNSGGTYFFSPKTANVPQGSTAQWTNTGTVSHTTTSDTTMPLSWDSRTLGVGAQFSFVFSAAGKYAYHCHIGEHSDEILSRAGYDEASIRQLRASGAVA